MIRRRRLVTAVIGASLAAVASAAFLAGHADPLVRLVGGLGGVDPLLAATGVIASAAAIANRGLLNQAAHRAVGLEANIAGMTHTAAVGFAAQKVVKSGGAIGLAVFVRHGRRRGHASSAVAAACVLSALASFVALGVLLMTAIAVLAATGDLTGWWIAAAIGFGIYASIVGVGVVLLVRSRRLAERLWRGVQRLVRIVRRDRARRRAPLSPLPTGLFEAIDAARRRRGVVPRILAHAILSKLFGALMLTVAVAAVGLPIDADDALIIYATALAASLVSIVPGGVGAVEGSTAALLIAAGASAGAAALAVALFRAFDLWLPVIAGAIAARGELRPTDRAASAAPDEPTALDAAVIGPVVGAASAVAAVGAPAVSPVAGAAAASS